MNPRDYNAIQQHSQQILRNSQGQRSEGNQTAADPNGFLDGKLYVLQVVDPTTNQGFSYETMPENRELTARWTLLMILQRAAAKI